MDMREGQRRARDYAFRTFTWRKFFALPPLCKSSREFVIGSRLTLRPFTLALGFSLVAVTLASLFFSFYRAWAFNVLGDPNRRRVRSHFAVNTARAVVSMRTTGSASRFNNRDPVLCLECHIRVPTTSMCARDSKQFDFDPPPTNELRAHAKTSVTERTPS